MKSIWGKEIKFRNNEIIDEEGKVGENSKIKKSLHSVFTFSSANIQIGTEITFTRNNDIKAKVILDKKVKYEREVYSLSMLAQKFLNNIMGYNWKAVQGQAYFEYEGEILSDIQGRLEEES